MASVTVRHLLNLAEGILQDAENDNWTLTDLINWYNLGARQTVILAPQANPIIESVKLAAGVRQTIPSKGLALIEIKRNMGTDGATAGDAVFPSTTKIMQSFLKGWSAATATVAIVHFMPETDRIWYNYPPSDGTGYVEEEYSKVPDAVTYDEDGDWESALVGVTDKYVDPILNFILSRAFAKDTDFPGNAARSQDHERQFLQAVGAGDIAAQKAQSARA
jgi:hypothetical protein